MSRADGERTIVAEWPDVGLRVLEVPEGLIVEQFHQWFLAKDWAWADDVAAFFDCCIGAGFACAIRGRTPQPNNRARGVKWIGMSKGPHDRWALCIDQYSPRAKSRSDRISRVTVEKAYRGALENAEI